MTPTLTEHVSWRPMPRAALLAILERYDACREAQEWAAATPGMPSELWAACPRGDWLLWLADECGVNPFVVHLAACDCLEPALPLLDEATRAELTAAMEAVRRVARGQSTYADEPHYPHPVTECGLYRRTTTCQAAIYAAKATERAAPSPLRVDALVESYQRSADLVRRLIPWAAVEYDLAMWSAHWQRRGEAPLW